MIKKSQEYSLFNNTKSKLMLFLFIFHISCKYKLCKLHVMFFLRNNVIIIIIIYCRLLYIILYNILLYCIDIMMNTDSYSKESHDM